MTQNIFGDPRLKFQSCLKYLLSAHLFILRHMANREHALLEAFAIICNDDYVVLGIIHSMDALAWVLFEMMLLYN